MAILFEKVRQGRCFQIRSAGKTRRLYTDGVFHSQFNPNNPLTGSVWDLLFLPTQFYRPDALPRVLLLGVGGGAAVHLLNRFNVHQSIMGIELEALHLTLARRFFQLEYRNLTLLNADAVAWLKAYQGPPFDVIIDDLYGEQDNQPQRAIAADAAWVRLLKRNLTRQGLIVMNFASGREWRGSEFKNSPQLLSGFRSIYQLSTPTCDNAVMAFLRINSETKALRQRLKKNTLLDPTRSSCRLRYKVRKLA